MAQIVTITNPLTGQPAQVDQLDHTAQQIDDSVKRALEYGLGAISKELTSDDDIDTITQNGWYKWGGSVPKNAPVTSSSGGKTYAFMRVSNYSSTDCIQEFWNLNDDTKYKLQRIRRNSAWQPIEWVNPPMLLGKEYRTTDRYQGKPVYAQALTVGSLAANTLSVAGSFSTGAENVVRAYAIATYRGSSFKTPQNGDFLSVTFTADGVVYSVNNQVRVNIKSSVDMTDCVAVAYYTKA